MIRIDAVANYILAMSDPDVGDGISNLKLQKLLYYCQGTYLAITDTPLFKNLIEAWEHGPVVPDVYQQYKKYGSENIPIPKEADLSPVASNNEIKKIMDEVYSIYGQFSAWRLRDMTHSEPPWKNTPKNQVISLEELKNYFKTTISK